MTEKPPNSKSEDKKVDPYQYFLDKKGAGGGMDE